MVPPAGANVPQFASDETEEVLKDKLRQLRFKDKEREVEAGAAQLHTPYINLEGFPINADSIAIVPEEESRALGLVCFWYSIGDLRLGSVNPLDAEVQAKAKEIGGRYHTVPILYLISLESLRIAQEAYRRVPKRYVSMTGVEISEEELNHHSAQISNLKDIEARFKNISTTEAVVVMVAGALKTRASDIHLEAEEKVVFLRYRIDGVLYPVATLPREIYTNIVSRLKLLSGLKINVTNKPQDGRFTISLTGNKVDVRVSTLPTAYGESIVMRLLQWSETGVNFEELGIVGRARDVLAAEITKPNGMILSTGPTGAGKTTTLYAIIRTLNGSSVKIITIEDPIEYRLPGVNQSQVDPSRDYTFANGLRSIVRQDPNIIMVGEIRDFETADISVNAALTGHLVLSTLHTNSASGAIPRLLNMGLKPFLISPSINAIIGQRLVRRVCRHCRQETSPGSSLLARTQKVLAGLPDVEKKSISKKLVFYKGDGCEECQGLGFKGQIGLFEVLVVTKTIEQAILTAQVSESRIEDLARQDGMVTMLEDGILKALDGTTTLEEIFRVAKERD